MPEEGLENTLYVGLDDSNHAGKRKGEIVVATFSFAYEDSIVQSFGKRSHHGEVDDWLSLPGRNYNFTLLSGRKFKHRHNNLPHAAKVLVPEFLDELNPKPNKLELFFDGELINYQICELKRDFSYIREVKITNFVKEKGCHNCPKLVYIADSLAHHHYEEYESILENRRFVMVE